MSSHEDLFNKPLFGASNTLFQNVLKEVKQEIQDDLGFAEE